LNAPSEQEEEILVLMLEVNNLEKFKKRMVLTRRKTTPTRTSSIPKKDARLWKILHAS
jgi:hypothetical protein